MIKAERIIEQERAVRLSERNTKAFLEALGLHAAQP
jgi:uncharacterized protein (DUF1778 family)